MEYLEFFLYGLIQGFTEFVPISSTAHLKVVSVLLGLEDPGSTISAIIQLGSVFAIFWYFRKDLFNSSNLTSNTILNIFTYKKLYKSIFIGTIPIILVGGFIKSFIPNFFQTFLRTNFSIAIISLVMALIMYFADISRNKFINITNHSYLNILLIGIAQSFAIVPGVSRSGITISFALLSGWQRRDAAKISFLLGLPAISLAAIVEIISSINDISLFALSPLMVGLVTAFLSSLIAIDFCLKYLSTKGLKLFIFYRVIFGLFILLNL